MLVVDDILFFPAKSLMWIFRQIHEAVQEELKNEVDSITDQLRELYMMVETGRISEEEFEAQEEALLDLLETISGGEENTEDDSSQDSWPEARREETTK